MRLSVIIPAYREPYLQRTVDSLLQASELGGGLEVIVVLDGQWLPKPLRVDPRVQVVQLDGHLGLRPAINAGLSRARGEFVMKADAHCSFSPGFDRAMVEAMEPDWVLIPRRYALEVEAWGPARTGHPRDYHFLNYPVWVEGYGYTMTAHYWDRRRVRAPQVDEVMTFQGSCWLVERQYFDRLLGGKLDDSPKTYGAFWLEYLEIGLKYWLTGGQVRVNKAAWYAHLAKRERHYDGDFSRAGKMGWPRLKYTTWAAKHWLTNKEPGLKYDFAWLVEKFWPVPTWPENRQLWRVP